MPTKNRGKSKGEQLQHISKQFEEWLPHLYAWLNNESDFREVRSMARDDGSTLAIAKGYDAEGAPVVAFGVGYGVVASFMALDATIHAGAWRVDKYFQP